MVIILDCLSRDGGSIPPRIAKLVRWIGDCGRKGTVARRQVRFLLGAPKFKWAVSVVGGTRALQALRNGSIPLRSTIFISL